MKKKKVKIKNYTFKLAARIWIINIPAVLILLFLMVLGKLSWISATISLLCFWTISAGIIILVFKDLDNFVNYLNQWTTNFGKEQPIFRRGLFSSSRLMSAFQAASRIWQQQALSNDYILTNLPDPIILINIQKQRTFCNVAAENLFHDVSFNNFIKDEKFKKAYSKIKKKPQVFEWQTGNRYFQVRLDKLPAPTRKGGVVEILLHEITEFKLFHQKQNDFFANASHELKTPLAVISGAVETLQGPAKDDKNAQNEFLSLIATQTTHMTRLVQSLLKLARQQMMQATTKKIAIVDLLQQLIYDIKNKAEQKKQNFIFNKPTQSPLLTANPTELYHLFQNLIDNAIKYGDENTPIKINVEVQKKLLLISVQNTGPLILPSDIPHLFDRFYRGKNKTTAEGSGLGLSIAQQLTQKYNGTIHVQSTPKTGTVFTVKIPISK